MLFDFGIHQVKGSGYNINVAFGDTHVALHTVPQEAGGQHRYRFPYQQDIMVPDEDRIGGVSTGAVDTTKWVQDDMWTYTESLSQVN